LLFFFDYGSCVLMFMLWGQAQRSNQQPARHYYAAACVAMLAVLNAVVFNFSPMLLTAATTLVVVICYGLWHFQLQPLAPYVPGRLLRFFSRQALPYYVLHRVALAFLAIYCF
jgi:hypothetical protein